MARAKRFQAVLRGEDKPADNAERLAFAQLACDQKHFALATRLWAEALASDPKRGNSRWDRPCGHAARVAALAAAGQGKDEPPLEAAKAKLRGQALDWLTAERTAWSKLLDSNRPQAGQTLVKPLSFWQQDPEMAGLRDPAVLAPPKPVQGWTLKLREKWIRSKKVVAHAKSITFQLAEVAVPRKLFARILERIARLCPACASG